MTKPSPGQMPLDFEPVRARKSDPNTSHKAAATVKAGTVRALILHCLSTHNLTTEQIAAILDKPRDSISPHMKPLEKMGHVRRTGQVSVSNSGKECEIWEKVSTT